MASSQFNPPAQFNNPPAPRQAPAPYRSRYAGIKTNSRDPAISPGRYRVRLESASREISKDPKKNGREFHKVSVSLVQNHTEEGAHKPGDSFTIINMLNPAGLAELKSMLIAFCGFGPTLADYSAGASLRKLWAEGEVAFDEFDEKCGYEGAVLEAVTGSISYGAPPNNTPPVVGRVADVEVSLGGEDGRGDFYRRYAWFAAE